MPGRITIFSLKTCRHCKNAKGFLKTKGWDFYDISLTDYPEKRSDMIKLTNSLTVPQIFFNKYYVGGFDKLDQMDEKELDGLYHNEIIDGIAPEEKEYQRPDYPPKEIEPIAEYKEAPIEIGKKSVPKGELQLLLRNELPIRSIRCGIYKYERVFRARELVDVLMKQFELSEKEAVSAGKHLAGETELIVPQGDNNAAFENNDDRWRLQMHARPYILNSFKIWNDRVEEPMKLIFHLSSMLNSLKSKHSKGPENLVDYVSLGKDPGFLIFREATCELQQIDLSKMDRGTRIAFLINVYNMMVLHAFAQVGNPSSTLNRGKFFNSMRYDIGGYQLSFNEIESGILRGNRHIPYTIAARTFPADHPILDKGIVLEKPEIRVHFALNCGARSCPPVKKFRPESLEEELRVVTQAFCEGNVTVDFASKTVTISTILYWYREDFGSSDLEVATTLVDWLRGQPKRDLEELIKLGARSRFSNRDGFKLEYAPYDWSNDASNIIDWTKNRTESEL